MKLTLLLILISIIVFFNTTQNHDYFLDKYGFSINALAEGRYYTILTSIFMHSNLVHLITNMLALLVLGGSVESKSGSIKYILVYLLTGMAGVFSALFAIFGYSPDTVFVGASGAISGLIGFGIFVNPGGLVFFPSIVPIPFVVASALYLLATIPLLFSQGSIAYPAHLFGLLTGMVFGFLFGERRIKRLVLFIGVLVLILMLPVILKYILG